jgi:protein TonB
MIIKKSSTFISGFLAFGIYFTLIGLLIFYFNTRDAKKSEHYVKKDEKRIQVSLSAPKKLEDKKVINSKPKVKPKPKPKPKIKPKVKPKPKPKLKPKKVIKKKVLKEKVVKKVIKKKDQNLTKPKKKALDLFANVKTSKKKNLIVVSDKPIKTVPKNDLIKVTDKPISASERINSSLRNQKSSDSGVEDAYLAKVQSMLEGWPAQSEYAGEKVKVLLLIDPTGGFEFKVKSASNNENFNSGLIEYLEQLQTIGFGRHKGARTYKFEAEFIAKE